MRLVFMGPPGAGKGTQAKLICEYFGIVHISTGDMIRELIRSDTPTGRKARIFVDKGSLVPDDTMIELVSARLGKSDCQSGFLLDGYPRTRIQGEALDRALNDKGLRLDAVLQLVVPDEEVVSRLAGRRTCKDCNANFHVISIRPRSDGRCDGCGGELFQRDDDRPEAIRQRLVEYHRQTEEVAAYFGTAGLVRQINGVGSVDEVQQRIRRTLKTQGS